MKEFWDYVKSRIFCDPTIKVGCYRKFPKDTLQRSIGAIELGLIGSNKEEVAGCGYKRQICPLLYLDKEGSFTNRETFDWKFGSVDFIHSYRFFAKEQECKHLEDAPARISTAYCHTLRLDPGQISWRLN